jgi:hypothetical protein
MKRRRLSLRCAGGPINLGHAAFALRYSELAGMKGSKTPAETEEAVFADYLTTLNHAETARRLDLPTRTVANIVKRLANDDLAELRSALRTDLAEKAFSKIAELIALVTPDNLGTARSSKGLEAARAAGEIGRIAALVKPAEIEGEPSQTTIVLCTCMKPPPEIEQAGIAE